jgi:EpsI family protein
VSDWKPAFGNPSGELTSTYSSQERKVGVYIAYYRAQNYDRKLVSSDNKLVRSNDPQWALVSAGGIRTLQTQAEELHVRTASLRHLSSLGAPEQRLVAWQVYWVADRFTTSDQWAKVYGALDRLLRQRDDSAVIVLYAREETPGDAGQLLESFAHANFDAIVAQLRKNRGEPKASIAINSYGTSLESEK